MDLDKPDVDINELENMIKMTGTENSEKNIFTAQDSMENIDPMENLVLNLKVPSVGGLHDLLYSEEIYDYEKEIGIEMPVNQLLKMKTKTIVLIGVSGCGKTRSCYDLCRTLWCLSFDCACDSDFLSMLDLLERCRPREKTKESQHIFEAESKRLLEFVITARLFVLKYLCRGDSMFKPFDWLCTQRSRRTQCLFSKIFQKFLSLSESSVLKLYRELTDTFTANGRIIFDESQTLLQRLQFDYRSSKDFQQGITNGAFDHPRSFFSFLSGIIIHSNWRSIWCGTHMKIRNMEFIRSSAGAKVEEIVVFTNFNYLRPTDVAQLLSKWLNTHLEPFFLQKASHILQGRPRFMISFLHRLRKVIVNDQTNHNLLEKLDSYCSFMTTRDGIEDTNSSLYSFWSQRIDLNITPFLSFSEDPFQKRRVSELLIKLCISFLFGDGSKISYSPDLDMVSTGLVMVDNYDTNWNAIMAEPIALSAGLNYLANQNYDALMDYFANQLFAPKGAPNLTPQERGNLMELLITLRFMMGWWNNPDVPEILSRWINNYSGHGIPKPRGVFDGRSGASGDIFMQQLKNDNFPWIVLPPTKAGPDIRYSVFSCYVKTTWTMNSETSVFVEPEVCRDNIYSMNPNNWYFSLPGLNQQVKDSLPKRLIQMRFELPYTAPLFANGEEDGFKSSLEGDYLVLCIDLNSDLAVPFFGKKFIDQYLKFIRLGIF